MSNLSSASIELDATADNVMQVIMDFSSYPKWSGFQSALVLPKRENLNQVPVQFGLSVNGVSDSLTLGIAQISESEVSWTLIESNLLSVLEGKFKLTELPGERCKVTYELELRFKNSMMNLMKKALEGQMIEKLLRRLVDEVASR